MNHYGNMPHELVAEIERLRRHIDGGPYHAMGFNGNVFQSDISVPVPSKKSCLWIFKFMMLAAWRGFWFFVKRTA